MIDHSLAVSPLAAFLFHLKQGFALYLWPVMIGFLTIVGYQALGRVVSMGTTKWPAVFAVASVVSMVSLFGWVNMVRGTEMIPLYGCGVGLASAMMSRVYAVTLPVNPWFPRLKMRTVRVIWRGDTAGIEQLQQALRARAAAAQPNALAGAPGSVEAARARV